MIRSKFKIIVLFLMLSSVTVSAQISYKEVGSLPEPVSNNAVVGGKINEDFYLFSFTGIDSSKKYDGIHLKSYRYNLKTGVSETIESLPDTLGKIACGASRIGDTIYIGGGYHVYENGGEKSSNLLHRYKISANRFLSNGTNIPTATDDHVQVVWRNQLIYLITGWNDVGNIPNVQIYNPKSDKWLTGTPVPNNNAYKSFGASGVIIKDTIFYFGGASSSPGFKIQSWLRKGVINPTDPTQIDWSFSSPNPTITRYRSAALVLNNRGYWIGGSENTYNYNGIAYDGSGGVDPTNSVLHWDNGWKQEELDGLPMDLRGIAQLNDSTCYIAGGMLVNQQVSNKIFKIELGNKNASVVTQGKPTISIYPNPFSESISISSEHRVQKIEIVNLFGQTVYSTDCNNRSINLSQLKSGFYRVLLSLENGQQLIKSLVKVQ